MSSREEGYVEFRAKYVWSIAHFDDPLATSGIAWFVGHSDFRGPMAVSRFRPMCVVSQLSTSAAPTVKRWQSSEEQ